MYPLLVRLNATYWFPLAWSPQVSNLLCLQAFYNSSGLPSQLADAYYG
jgi:hypothetical protein